MSNRKAGRETTPQGRKTIEYLGKYPDMPTRTLARLLKKDHPKLFTSVESARSLVRVYRGANGKGCRDNLTIRDFILPPPSEQNPFSMPEAWQDGPEYKPYILGPTYDRIGLLSDVHIPFHDVDALTVAVDHLKEQEINCLILNGDFADCYSLSRWERDPELRDFPKEREAVRHGLMALRNTFGDDVKFIYKQGNHEERYEKHLSDKAPDLLGLTEFRLDVLFGLCDMGIDWVATKRMIRCGKLDIAHGHEWGGGGGINPARWVFLRALSCVLIGHFHRRSEHEEPSLRDRLIASWSTGCLCNLHPRYRPQNKWWHGFAYIERQNEDDFEVHNHKIVNGRVV